MALQFLTKQFEKLKIITNDLYLFKSRNKTIWFFMDMTSNGNHYDDGFHYRHLLFDLINNAPIAELLAPP